MKLAVLFIAAFALTPAGAWAQAEQQEVRHHGMMHAADEEHPVSKTARLVMAADPASHEITIRIGPVNLPANTEHTSLPQPPTLWLTIPSDGWLTAYHPSLIDANGQTLPSKLLHQVDFYDTARPDFLCPAKEEHIFGSGTEMSDWPAISGFGYRVHKGDRVRISTSFGNPTAESYRDLFLQVRIEYQVQSEHAAGLRDVYPAWFDVMGCGEPSYDLAPGESTKTGEFKVPYSGELLGVGGYLHDYGQWLALKNIRENRTVATLEAKVDGQGRLLSIPIKLFNHGGVRLRDGDVIEVLDAYNNATGKRIIDGAMGIIVGYFLPDEDSQLTVLGHAVDRPQTR